MYNSLQHPVFTHQDADVPSITIGYEYPSSKESPQEDYADLCNNYQTDYSFCAEYGESSFDDMYFL